MSSRLFAGATIAVLIAAIVVISLGRPPDRPSTPPPIESPSASAVDAPTVHPEEFHNTQVTPGKVRWHASFAEAQAAAQQSGKPVLLLHMMGQLDRQFC